MLIYHWHEKIQLFKLIFGTKARQHLMSDSPYILLTRKEDKTGYIAKWGHGACPKLPENVYKNS